MKKVYVLFCVAIFIGSCAYSPDANIESLKGHKLKFKMLKKMKKGVYGMGSVTDGRFIYSVNGSVMGHIYGSALPSYRVNMHGEMTGSGGGIGASIGQTKHIYRYDIIENKWSVHPAQLKPKAFLSAEYVDGEIYIFNGEVRVYLSDRIERVASKNLEIFDVNTGEINYGTNNPYPAWYSGSAIWNNKIYVFGGSSKNGVYSDKVLVYDPYYDEWTHLTNMPVKMHTRGEIVNGLLYIFGGYDGIAKRDIYCYNIEMDEWRHVGYMPRSLSANAITKHGDFIWMIGDYYNLSRVAVFNTKTEEYYILKSNIYGRRHAGAEIIGNKLYVYGGNRESPGRPLTSIQVADISDIEKFLSEKE